MGYHFLLQGILLIQGSNLHLLHWLASSSLLSHWGSPLQSEVTAYIDLRISKGMKLTGNSRVDEDWCVRLDVARAEVGKTQERQILRAL